jgi:hypothetical protein
MLCHAMKPRASGYGTWLISGGWFAVTERCLIEVGGGLMLNGGNGGSWELNLELRVTGPEAWDRTGGDHRDGSE